MNKSHFKIVGTIFIAGLVVISAIIGIVRFSYHDRMFTQSPDKKAAIIILGTRVEDDGTPSDWLARRVDAGVDVWSKRAAEIIQTCGMQEARDIGDRCDLPKFILSGDNGWKRVDEIAAMKQAPSFAQVSESSVLEDGWNARTIDSCWRAKNVLGIDHAILITQAFHMPRALYLCNKLGVDSYGVVAEDGKNNIVHSYVRDWLASVLAWRDIERGYTPEHTE